MCSKVLRARIDEGQWPWPGVTYEWCGSNLSPVDSSAPCRRSTTMKYHWSVLTSVFFPQRRRSLFVCPLQSDRCSVTDHWAVPQVRPFIDDFRRRTDTLRLRTFDLAPVVAMAASQMGYLSPSRATASLLRHDDDVVVWAGTSDAVGLHGLSRLIRAATIRYDIVRADRAAGLMTADQPCQCVISLSCGQFVDKVVVPLLTSSDDDAVILTGS